MRYFFHLADRERDADPVGHDLPDHQTAKAVAVRYAGELLQDKPENLWTNGQLRVEVTDENGSLC